MIRQRHTTDNHHEVTSPSSSLHSIELPQTFQQAAQRSSPSASSTSSSEQRRRRRKQKHAFRSILSLPCLAALVLGIFWVLGSFLFLRRLKKEGSSSTVVRDFVHASSSRDGLLPPLVVQLSSWEDDTIHDVRLLLEGTSFSYPLPLNDTDGRAKTPNYNDLVMDFFEYDNTTRVIYHDYSLDIDHDILKQEAEKSPTKKMDEYYAFDDDFKRNTYYQSYDDDKLYQQKRCHRVSWHRHMPIECNKFHEFDFGGQTTKGLTHLLSSGAFKNVFLVMSGQDTMVYKMFVMKRRYDYKDYESNRVDSMVNERLDSSPYIVDLYGYCGLAQFGEAMPDGDMEEFAAPENGRHRISVKVYDEKELDPKNYLLPSEKISFCLQMAEALQLLHGYPGGVIVHDDIQLGQYLLTPDLKHIKLNDFNRAEPMLWDRKNQEYCKYRNGRGPGDWRAPEEFNDDPLDEKIDIYSLANNMYAVVTGAYPYWELGDHSAVREKVTSGEKPKFDKRWAENSYAEGKLMELLEQMFEFDPVKRIDIFGVVKYLRELAEENQKHIMTDDPKAKKFLERKKKEAEMREKVRSAAREQERKVKAARKAKEEEEKAAAKARYEEAGKARDDVTRKEQDAEDDKSEANASDKRDAE